MRLDFLDGFLYQYPEVHLNYLRHDFADTYCTEPRDRIYGARGLLIEQLRAAIKPDYEAPLVNVYRWTVLASIANVGDLDIFGQCQ